MLKENKVFPIILKQYKLAIDGIHGLSHWKRVEKLGLFLSTLTNADPVVISQFAYLHDSQRQDEGEDIDHGKRAADFVEKLYNDQLLHISPLQLEKLQAACYYHNCKTKFKVDDVTIQTCWDSDRLDLWRIGIKPKSNFLYTNEARKADVIEYARSLCNPQF